MAILTISREFGSGGEEIGQAVAQSLKYEYVDRNKIIDEIKHLGKLYERWEEEFDEHRPGFWERHDWSYQAFVALNQSIIFKYALKDNVVLLGRGGNFLLSGIPYALRIRIVAPRERRIERLIQREDVSLETARLMIEKADREMAGAVQLIYGKNWDDPKEYDVRFDTQTITAEEIVARVKQLLGEKEKQKSEEAVKALRLRATAAAIKAGIATNPKLLIPTFDVVVSGQTVVVRGIIHNPQEKEHIETEVKKLAGDVPVTCELHYRGLLR